MSYEVILALCKASAFLVLFPIMDTGRLHVPGLLQLSGVM